MPLSFYWIPARDAQRAQDELNAALGSLRVVSTEKHFCALPPDPGWAVCLEYVEAGGAEAKARSRAKRIDYKEVLDPETFAIFAALRARRKEIAGAEGVPVYAVMSNEQLAAMARHRCQALAELEAVEGVGKARTAKYGPRLLEALSDALAAQQDRAAGDEDE